MRRWRLLWTEGITDPDGGRQAYVVGPHLEAGSAEVEVLEVVTGEYACPNGHPFDGVYAVRCDECGALMAVVPLAVELELREQIVLILQNVEALKRAAIKDGVTDDVGAAIATLDVLARGSTE